MLRKAAWWEDESNGRVVLVPYPGSADLAQLSSPIQGAPPQLLAVQVHATDDVPPVAPDPLDARLLVDLAWGNGRVPLEATIDCGQTVTLAATSLRAIVRAPGTAPGALSRVRFMVSLASSPARHGPTFTDRRDALGAGGVTEWAVPPFARSVSMAYSYNPLAAASAILLEWLPPPLAGGVIARQASGGAPLSSPVVLVPRGARRLQITNGLVPTSATPIWELAL